MSANWFFSERALQNKAAIETLKWNTHYLTGILETAAAISLLSQLDCGHTNQQLNSVMDTGEASFRME